MFTNREQAGKLLARRLQDTLHREKELSTGGFVVVGLPRGGVPVALEIALALKCPLDILVAKKLPAPQSPELAIGAVCSTGISLLDTENARLVGASKDYIDRQAKRLRVETVQLECRLLDAAGIDKRPDMEGKCVILVDDGVATGMTALAALRSFRTASTGKLILATPVIAYDTYRRLSTECDYIESLHISRHFGSVGQYYQDFSQTQEEEVVIALKLAAGIDRSDSKNFNISA